MTPGGDDGGTAGGVAKHTENADDAMTRAMESGRRGLGPPAGRAAAVAGGSERAGARRRAGACCARRRGGGAGGVQRCCLAPQDIVPAEVGAELAGVTAGGGALLGLEWR